MGMGNVRAERKWLRVGRKKKGKALTWSLKFQEGEVSRDGSFVLSKVIKMHKPVG